jgi:hypothetical protein
LYSLRQKTYGIFIRPYVEFNGDRLIQRGNLYVRTPCQPCDYECPSYSSVKDGQGWILYQDEYHTSFPIIREKIKEIMDTLGYSKKDILVTEVIPIDTIVTPLT